MDTFTFTLTLAEANLIMEALSEMPFKRVVMLVNNLNQQAEAQAGSKQEKADDKGTEASGS